MAYEGAPELADAPDWEPDGIQPVTVAREPHRLFVRDRPAKRLTAADEAWTLEGIGHELRLTRERVRQLEAQAFARRDGAGGVNVPHRDQPADSGDWLADSRGFRVEAASGSLGIVEEVRRDADSGRPETLVVRGGVLATHRLDVPVDHISGVVTSRRLVVLSTDAPS